MFYYEGKSHETGKSIKREFDDESDAINFANNNAWEYQSFSVKDEEGDEIHSPEIDDDNIATAKDNMFPDEDNEQGFDWADADEED